MFASDDARLLLVRNGLGDLDAVFSAGATAGCRHTGRTVWSRELVDSAARSVRVFVKMNWGRLRLWPRMTDLKTGQWLQSLPAREWDGLGRIEQLGLNVPERLALFHRGLFSFRSAVIVRAVPAKQSVFEMFQQGSWQRLPRQTQQQIFNEMVSMMRTIHEAGLAWRGTSTRHFFPAQLAANVWKLWIIDCEGVHGHATPKSFQRDYRKLLKSLEQSGADRPTIDLLRKSINRISRPGVSDAA